MGLGLAELPIVLFVLAIWAVVIAAAIWVIVTLNRLAKNSSAICEKLEAIEQLLRRGTPGIGVH
jgi:hypothetical protein